MLNTRLAPPAPLTARGSTSLGPSSQAEPAVLHTNKQAPSTLVEDHKHPQYLTLQASGKKRKKHGFLFSTKKPPDAPKRFKRFVLVYFTGVECMSFAQATFTPQHLNFSSSSFIFFSMEKHKEIREEMKSESGPKVRIDIVFSKFVALLHVYPHFFATRVDKKHHQSCRGSLARSRWGRKGKVRGHGPS